MKKGLLLFACLWYTMLEKFSDKKHNDVCGVGTVIIPMYQEHVPFVRTRRGYKESASNNKRQTVNDVFGELYSY